MIELATFDDLNEILELQKLGFGIEAERYNDFNLPPLKQTLEDIQNQYNNNVLILKYTSGDKITGSVRAFLDDKNICHIGRLVVHPDHQKKGIARELMNEIEKKYADCFAYRIFTGHLSHHVIRLYVKLGYQIRYTEFAQTHYLVHMEKRNIHK
jgi:ribosomal protein S18 acetylase RimI-like enzyme